MISSKSTRQQWLKKKLISRIQEEKLQPHDSFLSERKISTEYNVSVPTVRLVLQGLIEKGLIYRIHGKGTFISPPSNNQTVLIVGKYDAELKSKEYALMDFLGGLMEEQRNRFPQYAPIVINHNTFISQLKDLQHIYTNIQGIVFFRDDKAVEAFFRASNRNDYPGIFFGSDAHQNQLGTITGIYHKEHDIITKGLEYLNGKNRKHIVYLNSDKSLALKSRKKQILEKQKEGIQIQTLELTYNPDFGHSDYYRNCESLFINNLPPKTDAIFCGDDWLAMYAIQALKKQGRSVPDDIAVLGINDYPFAEFLDPGLSTVRIELAQGGKMSLQKLAEKKDLKKSSYLSPKIIERQST